MDTLVNLEMKAHKSPNPNQERQYLTRNKDKKASKMKIHQPKQQKQWGL